MTLRDASEVIAQNVKSEKAYYRAARALMALDRPTECIDCCKRGLASANPENKDIKLLLTKATQRKESQDRTIAERAERERRKQQTQRALMQAFLARGLWIQNSPKPPDNPAQPHFDPENLASTSKIEGSGALPLSPASEATKWQAPDPIRTPLIFPVFFLYPQYAQSDLIATYQEDTPVGAYLDTMFPSAADAGAAPVAAWDARNEYRAERLQVYAATHKRRLLRLGRKLTLREVIDQGAKDVDKGEDRDGVVLQDGIISLIVLPKGSEAEKAWIDKFKKDRDQTAKK